MSTWWSEERIKTTVKQEYIERELGSKKYVDALHSVLAFGDGLTDDTYLDWILERSPRIFLILNHIGVPEKIFEVIDKSFADDDLPLSQDALWELNLFGGKSETLDKKFHREQFNFLIQELEPGRHVDYGAWEVVPLEPTVKRPSISTNPSGSDKVRVHKETYTRKKVASFGDDGVDEVHLTLHLKALTNIQHAHLVSIWATYSHDDLSYMLLSPSTEISLKAFLDEPPKAFKTLEKYDRRNILLTWTHCITSALAYLHENGFAHQSIRPSTILVDHNNTVFLNDYNALNALDLEQTNAPYSNELYEYSAPEHWVRKPCLHETAPLKTYLPGGGRTSRRIPKPAPIASNMPLSLPSTPKSQPSKRPGSRSGSSGSSTNTRPRNAFITTFAPPQREGSMASSSSQQGRKFASDVFSLTAVLLTLLSQILQHSPKSFASHRSRLNRQAGRGNAPPDSSFHKNLIQVTKWIDSLAKEAGQREKKDMKFWGAVVEIVRLCRLGIRKEARERVGAKDLEHEIAGWVHWGLARRRKCTCVIHGEEEPTRKKTEDRICEPEPASQYRIPQLQGVKQPSSPIKQKVDYPFKVPDESLDSASMDQQEGSTRPPSLESYKKSRVWRLSSLAHFHEKSERPVSLVSDKESTVWGLEDVAEDDYHSGRCSTPQDTIRRSDIAVGVMGHYDDYDDYGSDEGDDGTETETETLGDQQDWPLPLGTLTLSR